MNKLLITLISLFLFIATNSNAQSSKIDIPFLSKCEKIDSSNRASCTELVFFNYIKNRLNYPKTALETNIEGIVLVSFIITQEGKVISAKCEKNIGGGCGQEAVEVIKSINSSELNWQAGQKNGKKTSFQVLNYPIFFDIVPVSHTVPSLEMVFFKEKITAIKIGTKEKITTKEAKIHNRLLPKIEEDNKLYLEADQLPIFPGCQNGGPFRDSLKALDCSRMALNSYIYKVLEYPTRPFSEGIEGIVYVKYTTEKDGLISNIKIVKGLTPSCNQAVIDAIKSMNAKGIRWKPAMINNQPVRLQQELVVRFNIASEKERRAKNGY